MNLLCSNEQAIAYLCGDNSLLDGELERCNIFRSGSGFSADIHVRMRPSAEYRHVLVRFDECREFVFSHSDEYYFYNIERVKAICLAKNDFYVSLDPADESSEVSDEDNDLFRSKVVHLFAVD